MTELAMFLGAIFILGAFIISIVALCEHKNPIPLIVFVSMFLGYSIILGLRIKDKHPTAIEVYQGKTTLEVTYRDSIPVDSVVVYKK